VDVRDHRRGGGRGGSIKGKRGVYLAMGSHEKGLYGRRPWGKRDGENSELGNRMTDAKRRNARRRENTRKRGGAGHDKFFVFGLVFGFIGKKGDNGILS